jgi:hypothetical protein
MTMKTLALTAVAAVAILGLAACDASTKAAAEAPPAPVQAAAGPPAEADIPNYDQPLTTASMAGCIVVLQLADRAIGAGTLQADRPAIVAAKAKYQAKLEAAFNEDERAQLVGSTVAFYDQLTPAQLKSSVDVCLAAQDQTFSAEDG